MKRKGITAILLAQVSCKEGWGVHVQIRRRSGRLQETHHGSL